MPTGVASLIVALLISLPLSAQTAGPLSGTVTSPAGTAVSNATVSVKNLSTSQSTEVQTDPAGRYGVPGLAPGEYEVSASVEGVGVKTVTVTLTAGAAQKLDLALAAAGAAPSLGDLGFTPSQVAGNPQEQARLDKRSHMLKMHQRMGLITILPLAATLITSGGAASRKSSASARELHATLGAVTTGMYLTTASFAIFAPKIPGTKTRGPIRVHKALAFVHGAGMILTPILGSMAYNQRSNGQKVHGIASAHGAVAATTGIAYGLAVLSVSIRF